MYDGGSPGRDGGAVAVGHEQAYYEVGIRGGGGREEVSLIVRLTLHHNTSDTLVTGMAPATGDSKVSEMTIASSISQWQHLA